MTHTTVADSGGLIWLTGVLYRALKSKYTLTSFAFHPYWNATTAAGTVLTEGCFMATVIWKHCHCNAEATLCAIHALSLLYTWPKKRNHAQQLAVVYANQWGLVLFFSQVTYVPLAFYEIKGTLMSNISQFRLVKYDFKVLFSNFQWINIDY